MFRTVFFFYLVCLICSSCVLPNHKQKSLFADTVRCSQDPSYYYSIFIPDSLSRKDKCPVLFLLDPGGEADSVVLKYRNLAQKYKVILASSYQVKNGLYTLNYNSLKLMINDVLVNYPVDESAQIIAGFSGGSRIAYNYASDEKTIQGVIGSGAYFPGNDEDIVLPRFKYSAIVGTYDFNFAEGLSMHNLMWKNNVPHQFLVHNGDHSWPPENILDRSLTYQLSLLPDYTYRKYDYLDLERMALQESNSNGDLINSVWIMDNIKLLDNQIQTAYQILIQNKKYKLKQIEFENSFRTEDSLKQVIIEGVKGIFLKGTQLESQGTKSMQWWQFRINDINLLIANKNSIYQANAAQRALAHLGIIMWEVNRKVMQEKQFEQALETSEILIETFPDNSTYRALKAEALFALGEKEKAKQFYLEAINLGFKDNNKYIKYSPFIKQLSFQTKEMTLVN